MYDVDVWGVIHGCHTFVPRMKAQGRGHIVNMSSAAAFITSLETIAGKVIKAIEKNRPYVVPNAFGRINQFQKGIAPTLFDAAWSFLLKSGIAKPLFLRLARLGIF